LSEGFAFSDGASGLMAGSVWFIVRWRGGEGGAEASVDPDDKNLQISDLYRLAFLQFLAFSYLGFVESTKTYITDRV